LTKFLAKLKFSSNQCKTNNYVLAFFIISEV
jgi:hypothetical protein